jgi:hypothetical protein
MIGSGELVRIIDYPLNRDFNGRVGMILGARRMPLGIIYIVSILKLREEIEIAEHLIKWIDDDDVGLDYR